METDVLLIQASLEGEGQWRDRRGPHAQDETSFSAFVNTGETVSAWIPRCYPTKGYVPRLGSSDCSCKEEPLKDPASISGLEPTSKGVK